MASGGVEIMITELRKTDDGDGVATRKVCLYQFTRFVPHQSVGNGRCTNKI